MSSQISTSTPATVFRRQNLLLTVQALHPRAPLAGLTASTTPTGSFCTHEIQPDGIRYTWALIEFRSQLYTLQSRCFTTNTHPTPHNKTAIQYTVLFTDYSTAVVRFQWRVFGHIFDFTPRRVICLTGTENGVPLSSAPTFLNGVDTVPFQTWTRTWTHISR